MDSRVALPDIVDANIRVKDWTSSLCYLIKYRKGVEGAIAEGRGDWGRRCGNGEAQRKLARGIEEPLKLEPNSMVFLFWNPDSRRRKLGGGRVRWDWWGKGLEIARCH
jgi:hypothetical protein